MKGELSPKRIAILLLPILVGFCFVIAGIEFLREGTPDDTLAGIVMLVLGGWTIIFLLLMMGCILRTVVIDEESVIFRKGFRLKRCAFADVEDAFCECNAMGVTTLRILLKNGSHFFATGLKNGRALANELRKRLSLSTVSKSVDTLKNEYLKSKKIRLFSSIILWVLIGLAVICLGIAVVTTGEKDLVDFNAWDWQYFSAFMASCAAFLVAIAPALAWQLCLVGEMEAKAWAWKRGVCFADSIALTLVNGVYVDGGFTTRIVCGKVVDNDVEIEAISVEEYQVKGDMINKSATTFYDEETKNFWKQRIYSGELFPIMDTKIEDEDIFIL